MSGTAKAARKRDNDGMEITLNGKPHVLGKDTPDADHTIVGLLDETGLGERRVAVEVNGVIVPRSAHASEILRAGDKVEIVHALGGG